MLDNARKDDVPQSVFVELRDKILDNRAVVGVIGMGYVGLPLAATILDADFSVVGFDVDPMKVKTLNSGGSYIRHIVAERISGMLATTRFEATERFERLKDCDVILICVPTPLNRNREPDLSYVESTTAKIAEHLRDGQLIVLESTTYPGTTTDLMRPILEAGGLRSGHEFFLAYSPEREDPGNANFATARIPKVVGGDGQHALEVADLFYSKIVSSSVSVSSCSTAEAVKLTENIFRAVNIALVNELKVIYDAMGIDVWEVIDAAATKPFGFMPFYPGPGLGGHCIPIDPFYLTWKAREFDINTRFIELAGEVNSRMPHWVVERLARTIDQRSGKGLNGSLVLVVGLAYKPNVDDIRESPSLKLIELIEARGAHVDYHDPYIDEIIITREHPALAGRHSVPLGSNVAKYDAVLIATDHDSVDYADLVQYATLVVDTRNVCARKGVSNDNIVKA